VDWFRELARSGADVSGVTVYAATVLGDRGACCRQPYDVEVGAGTMSPDTFLRVLGPEAGEDCVCASFAQAGGWQVMGRIRTGCFRHTQLQWF